MSMIEVNLSQNGTLIVVIDRDTGLHLVAALGEVLDEPISYSQIPTMSHLRTTLERQLRELSELKTLERK
jgi:hypothetical protein